MRTWDECVWWSVSVTGEVTPGNVFSVPAGMITSCVCVWLVNESGSHFLFPPRSDNTKKRENTHRHVHYYKMDSIFTGCFTKSAKVWFAQQWRYSPAMTHKWCFFYLAPYWVINTEACPHHTVLSGNTHTHSRAHPQVVRRSEMSAGWKLNQTLNDRFTAGFQSLSP